MLGYICMKKGKLWNGSFQAVRKVRELFSSHIMHIHTHMHTHITVSFAFLTTSPYYICNCKNTGDFLK